jgi:hypothetical protein
MHHQNMLQGRWGWWVGNIVFPSIVGLGVGVVAPCVDHFD